MSALGDHKRIGRYFEIGGMQLICTVNVITIVYCDGNCVVRE
jgi:hypothetical protein